MRRARATSLAAAAGLLAVACGPGRGLRSETPAPPAEEGSAVLFEVQGDPTVSIKVWFKVGSQDDPPGREGLASLTAEMLSRGSTTRNPYEAILDKLYPMASSYAASVDREMTVFSGRTHGDNAGPYVELFTDAFLRPAFTEEDFERLRAEALNYLEKTLRYASDEELGKAALLGEIFAGTRYAHPPEGTVEGLRAITLDDVRSFYASHFTAASATPALGGGFTRDLVARLERAVRGLPPGRPAAPPLPEPAPIRGIEVLLVDKPGADASISFGFPIAARRGESDFYALWLANSWLGEHRNSSSHLYQVIREKRGMNYGDYSYVEAFPQGGMRSMPPTGAGRRRQIFEVWIRTLPNEDAVFALRAAVRELQQLVARGLTREQLELTRSFLAKYCLHFAETTDQRLGYRIDDAFYGVGGEGHLARFRRRMDELTLEEVNAAVRKHLQHQDFRIAVVTGQAKALKRALVSGAPSPKQYASPKPLEIVEEDRAIATFPLAIAEDRVRIVSVDRMFQGG